jgi:hypothetical protein
LTLTQAFLTSPLRTTRYVARTRREARRVDRTLASSDAIVIAYGHPKTATTSTADALAGVTGVTSFHAHVLQPRHFTWVRNTFIPPTDAGICPEDGPAQWALADALHGPRPIHLVTLVRDPIAVQISWFFFGLQRWLRSSRPVDIATIPFEELLRLFRGSFPRDGVLNWFEHEWCPVTGHDVDDLRDVRDGGCSVVPFGPHRAAVMSAELSDDRKSRHLESFLDLPAGSVTFPRSNLGADRRRPEVYDRLKVAIGRDSDHLDRVYASPFARTFFTPDTLDGFRRRWTGESR